MDIIEILKIVEDGLNRNWGDRRICLKLAVETPLTLNQAGVMIVGYKIALSQTRVPNKNRLIRDFTRLANEALHV